MTSPLWHTARRWLIAFALAAALYFALNCRGPVDPTPAATPLAGAWRLTGTMHVCADTVDFYLYQHDTQVSGWAEWRFTCNATPEGPHLLRANGYARNDSLLLTFSHLTSSSCPNCAVLAARAHGDTLRLNGTYYDTLGGVGYCEFNRR